MAESAKPVRAEREVMVMVVDTFIILYMQLFDIVCLLCNKMNLVIDDETD